MDSSCDGHPAGPQHAGFYAAVAYLPSLLGSYLSALRTELAPGCTLRSHLTLLPPRHLAAPRETLERELGRLAREIPSFEVTLGEIEVFPSTGVVYVSLAAGGQEAERAHHALNHGIFFAEDSFPFHPHVTVAHNVSRLPFEQVLSEARRRWQECHLPRQFLVEDVTLVRSVSPGVWEDLATHRLAPVSLLRTA